jgi:ketosteroid isomerase-like protein
MKIHLAKVFMVSLVLGVMFSQAWADDSTAREDIQALFNLAAASFDKKDVKGVTSTAVPDATLRYLDGTTISLEQWKANAQKEFAVMETMRSEFKVERAEVVGNSALATYTETQDYVLASEKGHQYRSVSRWSVTLPRTPQGWRAKHFMQLSEKITRDGKPFTPPTPPNKL